MYNDNDLLTEAEKAALSLIKELENEWPWGTAEELARDIVAAVRPILKSESDTTNENED